MVLFLQEAKLHIREKQRMFFPSSQINPAGDVGMFSITCVFLTHKQYFRQSYLQYSGVDNKHTKLFCENVQLLI